MFLSTSINISFTHDPTSYVAFFTTSRLNKGFVVVVVNIPPRAYPGHLTVHRAQGGGNLNVALEGWGICTRFISCPDVIRP